MATAPKKGGFNKLFVMAPVMLAARKLDAEDPTTVQYLRIAYGSMQSICVLVVLYTFYKATSLSGNATSNIVFVPAPPTVRFVEAPCGLVLEFLCLFLMHLLSSLFVSPRGRLSVTFIF